MNKAVLNRNVIPIRSGSSGIPKVAFILGCWASFFIGLMLALILTWWFAPC